MSDLLKVKVGGKNYLCKWKPMPYKELEYIQFDRSVGGANFIIPVTSFNNTDKDIVCKFELDGVAAGVLNDILYVGRNNRYDPGILIRTVIWSSGTTLDVYGRNTLAEYYTPFFRLNSFTYRMTAHMKNSSYTLKFSDGSTESIGVSYAGTDGYSKIYLFTQGYPGQDQYQFWGKFYGLYITDVVDLRPARRKSDNVLGLYDAVSDSFITANYGAANIIAGPDKG